MTPLIEEMRTALDADIAASAKNVLARFDPADPSFSESQVGKFSSEKGIPLSGWGYNTSAQREGEIVIKRKGLQIVVPHSRNPFLVTVPSVTHRFESETSLAQCVTALDALDIVFEDDGLEVAQFLECLGVTFEPKITGNTLRFERIELFAA